MNIEVKKYNIGSDLICCGVLSNRVLLFYFENQYSYRYLEIEITKMYGTVDHKYIKNNIYDVLENATISNGNIKKIEFVYNYCGKKYKYTDTFIEREYSNTNICIIAQLLQNI